MSHIHEKIDFTVEVFVVYKDKVLLRKHDKYKIWLSVGGHIELDEDPNEAAIREVKEEVGLDITLYDNSNHLPKTDKWKEIISPVMMNRHRINPNHEHVTFVYFAKSKSNKIIQSETEAGECKWFTKNELSDKFFGIKEDVSFCAKMALDKLS
jgi:8-oxo-dGTP pyrophosphatase MutT (NUDIX family)